MITLISNDDKRVDFTREMALEIPYVKDIMGEDESFDLPAPLLREKDLELLHEALTAYMRGSPLRRGHRSWAPQKETMRLKTHNVPLPPFVGYVWDNKALDTFFLSLSAEDIANLITTANFMAMLELRNTTIKLMLMRMVVCDAKLEDFFPEVSPYYLEIIKGVYKEELTTVADNGCCALLGSNNSD